MTPPTPDLPDPARTPRATRLYVLVDLGRPVRGRGGYRGVGTVRCASRAETQAAARRAEREGPGAGPVGVMLARVAGRRLLAEALAADGDALLARERRRR
jgi:hypothetical protein